MPPATEPSRGYPYSQLTVDRFQQFLRLFPLRLRQRLVVSRGSSRTAQSERLCRVGIRRISKRTERTEGTALPTARTEGCRGVSKAEQLRFLIGCLENSGADMVEEIRKRFPGIFDVVVLTDVGIVEMENCFFADPEFCFKKLCVSRESVDLHLKK